MKQIKSEWPATVHATLSNFTEIPNHEWEKARPDFSVAFPVGGFGSEPRALSQGR